MAKTLKGRVVYVCAAAQATLPLNLAAFQALTFVAVGNVGSIGESGPNTNMPAYDELETDVTQKGKGITDAGNPPIECSYSSTDPGQIILRAAALTNSDYAVAWVDDDGVTYYNCGKINGPTHPNGRNEDFRLDVFTVGANQREVITTVSSAPVNVLPPAVTGVADASSGLLTCLEGEWSGLPTSYVYQWQTDVAGNLSFSDISGATSRTYDMVAGDVGDHIRVGVKGVNAAGTTASYTYSFPSSLVVS